MPFTPFHLGPALFLGLLLKKGMDLPTLLIGSIIIDIEGFLVIFLNLNYPLHGYAHTFLGIIIIAVILSVFMLYFRPKMEGMMSFLKLKQNFSGKTIFGGAFLGVFSHVFLDAFLYTDIKPFFPSHYNPLYGLFSSLFVYNICVVFFLASTIIYLIKLIKSER